jgi:aspartyl-tRNA(Asn)/glutamyl-tRNA(Gln) amidotransferase subunit C
MSADEVRKVARLARLEIPERNVEEYRERLGAVLAYAECLGHLDLEGVEPLAQVCEEAMCLRADEPGPTLPTEALMRMAPASMPPFVRIPKVLGDGGGA